MLKLLKKYKTVLFFACAGVFGYVVDVTVTLLFSPLTGEYLARAPAFIAASTSTWLINRKLTFSGRETEKGLFSEWLHYMSLMLGGLLINYIGYAVVIYLLPRGVVSIAVAVGIGSLLGMTVNYLTSSKYLYK